METKQEAKHDTQDVAEALRIAKIALVQRMPYLAGAVLRFSLIPMPSIPTMGINERLQLFYNPDFVLLQRPYDLVALLFHEVLHWLREHTGERGKSFNKVLQEELAERFALEGEGRAGLAQKLANVAYDLEINDDLQAAFPKHRLHGGFFPASLGFPEGLMGEEYARLLMERFAPLSALDLEKTLGGLDGKGEVVFGEEGDPSGDASGISPALAEAIRRGVALEVVEASKFQGDVPGGLERWAKERLQARVSWRSLLREAVRLGLTSFRSQRFPTWSRPHRRAEALSPFILPGKYGRLPKVACVIDTSGSVSDELLSQAVAEVEAILRVGARVTVYSVDATVHLAKRVFRREDLERLAGGGGTDMGEGIARAIEDGHDLVIVLTDGETPWPETPQKARVVACLLKKGAPEPPSWIQTVRVA